jgi:hypothetical protein
MLEWGPVRLGQVRLGSAGLGKALSWKAGVVQSEVQYGKVFGRLSCGVAWIGEALQRVVKFCPVKHCVVFCAKALLWRGTVGSGFARLRAVGQGLVRFYFGLATQGGVLLSTARQGKASPYFGIALRGWMMRGRVWFGYGNVRLQK